MAENKSEKGQKHRSVYKVCQLVCGVTADRRGLVNGALQTYTKSKNFTNCSVDFNLEVNIGRRLADH